MLRSLASKSLEDWVGVLILLVVGPVTFMLYRWSVRVWRRREENNHG